MLLLLITETERRPPNCSREEIKQQTKRAKMERASSAAMLGAQQLILPQQQRLLPEAVELLLDVLQHLSCGAP